MWEFFTMLQHCVMDSILDLHVDRRRTVSFYLFNLTNAEEWQTNGTKPKLRAVGPYRYRRITKKSDIHFSEGSCGQRVLEYKLSTVYHFEPNGFTRDPRQDRLIVPNFVEGIANSMIKQAGSLGTRAVWYFLSKPLLLNLTAEEIMWGHEYGNLVAGRVLGMVEDAKIGLFNRLNNTIYGPYKTDTGNINISRLGALVAFEGKTQLDKWGSDYANMLNGTADIITPPSVKMGDRRYMFSTEICRSVPLVAKKWVSAKNFPQLKLLSLEIDSKVFLSADEDPDNAAFHAHVYPTNKYPPTGLLSISPCVDFGIEGDEPLFISLPFFNQAADEVKDSVAFDGLIEPHLTSQVHVDPKTGILVEGELFFQINIFLSKTIQRTPKDIYFPLAYINECALFVVLHTLQMPIPLLLKTTYAEQESAKQLYRMVYETPEVIRRALRSLLGLSAILAVLFSISALILHWREHRHLFAPSEVNCGLEEGSLKEEDSFYCMF
ncbi:unnamed protein product [Hydatigera taeniaeformis]|uniref:Scavenger receptor class B member 1 n=1 Tax=Hydatigena taeniaeformis TaxID=6205 RepID=A0A0R3WZC3_HYDTA|nr:unnamed protein product [Hydatigera taeniaeformis]